MNTYINIEKENLRIRLTDKFELIIGDLQNNTLIEISPQVAIELLTMGSTLIRGLEQMAQLDIFKNQDDFT